MEVMGGSEHSQQGQESETAIAVDKEFTNEKKDAETKEDWGTSANSQLITDSETATALEENEVSHENFDTDANDHSKQGPEPDMGTETQNGPELELQMVVILP